MSTQPISAEQVWEAVPWEARRGILAPEDDLKKEIDAHLWQSDAPVDHAVWDANRIVKTPWNLLPFPVRRFIFDQLDCAEFQETP